MRKKSESDNVGQTRKPQYEECGLSMSAGCPYSGYEERSDGLLCPSYKETASWRSEKITVVDIEEADVSATRQIGEQRNRPQV